MGGNDSNLRFSERTLPLVQAAINEWCLRPIKIRDIDNTEFGGVEVSDFHADLRENSDLNFAYAGDVQLGVRVRTNKYLQRYGNEFTLRSRTTYGMCTEIHKVLDGCGKFFFYGFANPAVTALCRWFVGDFHVFRQWYADRAAAGLPTHGHEIDNHDGTFGFAYNLNKLPPHFKVCSWSPDRGFQTFQVPQVMF